MVTLSQSETHKLVAMSLIKEKMRKANDFSFVQHGQLDVNFENMGYTMGMLEKGK